MSRNALTIAKVLCWLLPALHSLVILTPHALDAVEVPALTPTKRAKVISVSDPAATEAFRPRPEHIQAMVNRGITLLTGKPSVPEAWLSLVSTQDVVGIKVYSLPGPNSGTRPAVVAAMVEGLLAAGLQPKQIVVWDKRLVDLRLSGFFDLRDKYGIRIASSSDAGYDEKSYYDVALIGNLLWGDLEFGKKGPEYGRKSFVSKLLTQDVTKIINCTPLLNHNQAGVSGNLYGLATGSVDNIVRFENSADRLASAVPEIYALPALSDHVVLSITDALVCQYEGGERGLLHHSATLNQIWFSFDPVALDTLSLDELERRRRASEAPVLKAAQEIYQNAAVLELGINDLKKIMVEKVSLNGSEPSTGSSPAGY